MHFLWNDQSIQWFLEASAYTGFHQRLAKRLVPFLRADDTLCDMGCGLGRLDLEIAPYVARLAAVDINEKVIAKLQSDVILSGVQNLQAFCADITEMKESFDVVVMSFFGGSGYGMDGYLARCRRRLIRIVNAENKGSLYPGSHRRTVKETIPTVKQELLDQGCRFELVTDSIEFGQPLRSMEEAKGFVLWNAPGASEEEVKEFLRENAEHTGRKDFPIYLPNPKKIGVFVIICGEE
ncbi:MAG: methyltransferase domain-containing protein [Peptococcaceae bacterium]|nr:methyltransferase domain-containing protein [Peptococcaceae bacterium]